MAITRAALTEADIRTLVRGATEDERAAAVHKLCRRMDAELTEEERRMFTPVRQRLVRTHPVTGRKSLYLSSHIGTIIGWPMPEARAFIRDLTEHAVQEQFLYRHVWRQYDLVMWDNRTTMHRVTRFDETQVRDMRRTTVAGDGVTVEQLQAA